MSETTETADPQPEVSAAAFHWVRWAVAVVVCGVVGLVITAQIYQDFMDCSVKEIHESANTPLGWAIAIVATAIPAVFATRSGHRRLIVVACLTATVELVVWWWAFTAGDC